MRLQLIGSLTAPLVTGVDADDAYYSEPMEEFRDKALEMGKKSDVARATLSDGEEIYLTKQNFNFGQCDCCSDYGSKKKVIKYDFYEAE